jgi:hypothetical protein
MQKKGRSFDVVVTKGLYALKLAFNLKLDDVTN